MKENNPANWHVTWVGKPEDKKHSKVSYPIKLQAFSYQENWFSFDMWLKAAMITTKLLEKNITFPRFARSTVI